MGYPHCGSKEYQLQKFKQRQEAENAENVDPNGMRAENEEEEDTDYDEADDDDDFVRKKRQSKRIYNMKNKKESDNDDDDDDITSNAEEWLAHSKKNRMDEDR